MKIIINESQYKKLFLNESSNLQPEELSNLNTNYSKLKTNLLNKIKGDISKKVNKESSSVTGKIIQFFIDEEKTIELIYKPISENIDTLIDDLIFNCDISNYEKSLYAIVDSIMDNIKNNIDKQGSIKKWAISKTVNKSMENDSKNINAFINNDSKNINAFINTLGKYVFGFANRLQNDILTEPIRSKLLNRPVPCIKRVKPEDIKNKIQLSINDLVDTIKNI
jgi:hypothetical protein